MEAAKLNTLNTNCPHVGNHILWGATVIMRRKTLTIPFPRENIEENTALKGL